MRTRRARGGIAAGRYGRTLSRVDIEAEIANLNDHYTPERAALVERMLRAYAGTNPDRQLIEDDRRSPKTAISTPPSCASKIES